MAGATIDTLRIAGDPERWRELGFRVDHEGVCRLGSTILRIGREGASSGADAGIVSWTLRGSRGHGPIDGLPTVRLAEAATAGSPSPEHPNSARSIDHLVVRTPDFERTLEAIDAAGMRLRRTRETPNGMRQGFFRHGEAIVEVVGPREPEGDHPASFWGLVATVREIELAAELAGLRLGRVRDAVQPGRRIATFAADAGLSVRLALITS